MSRSRLPPIDWSDRDQLRKWFAKLSAEIDQVTEVVEDMLLPLRRRRFGPAGARELHREAQGRLRAILDAGERGL